jgi:hypothetical protein
MGTNYYAKIDACPTCGHGKEIHIGKSSFGWTFSFHAVDEWKLPEMECGIRSYKEWLEFLSKPNVKIFDEYGVEKSLKEFKDLVESKRKEKMNHTIYCKREYPKDDRNFLDSEGHSFSNGEFS